MPQILIEDSGNLKHLKNVESISNTTVSHLVSCRVIPRAATMKGWEKKVFWKIHALGNLKYNKSTNLESRWNPWKNTWKVTASKANLYRDSQEIVWIAVLQNTS